ncbi:MULTISPECIES: hypothetical protein [Tenacibaculum]|uniref:hypothetical protein n=1 Tax=Tenacibaculum TaxID=104267 RepID=UPI000F25B016|nr:MULTISPECIES: hypothetical protein [Tenacibaculum]NVK09486.1 hypothetical protein [Tenacibaculum sp.]RLJ97797.1 hypothetical protein C8N27_2888 [Tenacibaculum discolor]
MKKSILNLGKALDKKKQTKITGGYPQEDCEFPKYSCFNIFGQQTCCDPLK